MPSLDELLNTLSAEPDDYLHDSVQFMIDENLRIIAIPSDGVVAGVVGDKNVNHINFQMQRYYNGFDMSTFSARIKYINAGGEANVSTVTDMTIENDILLFTWLVDSDVTKYSGTVAFSVNLYKNETSETARQSFNTANNSTLRVFDGVDIGDITTRVEPESMTALLGDSVSVNTDADYLHDSVQFEIDENLRIVTVPSDGVVAGVVGDKNVNHINFRMSRYYNGFDMSKFAARIKYVNAGGDANFYSVNDLTVEDNLLLFTWLVDSDVTKYSGTVAFSVNLVKATSAGTVQQSFNTANNSSLRVLEGIEVDMQITPEEQADILAKMTAALEAKKDSIIAELDGNQNAQLIQQNAYEIDKLKTGAEETAMTLSSKVDGGYVGEDGCLYLTADDEIVIGPLGPFAGTGGGTSGGGSGSGNNAVLSLSNTSGWLSKTIGQNNDCVLNFNWSSLENDLSTGAGTLNIRVNGALKVTKSVDQGDVSINVKDFINIGTNKIKLTITDVYDNTRTINFSVMVVAISIRSSFDTSVTYSDSINFTYIPTGDVLKTVHFILDGKEIGTTTTSVSGRQQTYVIPKQPHGVHTLKVYLTCEMSGNTVSSNELYYEITCVASGNNNPIIASEYVAGDVKQYESLPVTYKVYDPTSLTTSVKLYANDVLVNTLTVDRTTQTWVYRAEKTGTLKLKVTASNEYSTVSKEWTFNVVKSDVAVSAETENLSLFLSSYGRSNNEENPGTWKSENVSVKFSNFNFVSDGWIIDKDNITTLRVAGDARLSIPLKLFSTDFRATGKTMEFEFSTSEVMDYDAVILSCMSGGRGIELTAQKVTLKSEQSEIFTQYKEDEHVRVSFVIEKRSENRLIYCYINGVMSGVVQYPVDDDFSQQTPVDISIGSNDCVINLYCIRIYDNDLTRYQMLDNWIADSQNVDELLSRSSHNNVFDAYGAVVIDKLPNDLPYIVLQAPELPTYKGDKKTVDGYYIDPTDSSKNFTFTGAQADVQGTSSAGYERKNFKIKFKNGFVVNGETISDYAIRGEADSIPASTFTFKADVASSEGANNVELVRLYDDTCTYMTPPQKKDPRCRQGIDGFPILMFQDTGSQTTFIGKYNFNNDKSNEAVFGFSEGDECWEILNNTSSRVNWKSADYSGEDWLNDFEGRYPDGYTDPTNLAQLAAFIVSTDQTKATGNALATAKVYDGVSYATDTAEYRLAKFKNGITDWVDKSSLLFYYLFTELFLMVDSRAKNAFPTRFNGDKWCFFPYDFDTAIGINNEGALVFSYELEDIDTVEGANVYNGQESVLWINTRQAFFDDIASMYQTLRAQGKLSYADTEKRFEDHQTKWPEAIFNEDAWYKYLQPLVEKGNAAYLSMLQGSKAEQRKWWLYNRYRYIDSKYNAGDALADFIMIRAYAKDDITVTPYADIYATIKYGSYTVRKRALRGNSYTLDCPLDTFNDTECYIYSSSQLKSVGDLSGLMVGYADFSKATRLQSLKLGDSNSSYSNNNMKELYLGNNKLLKVLDVRNCPNLTQSIDVSGCSNLEEVYFDGTSITGINLPVGGILKKLHLPATITNLTIRNQNGITDLQIPSYDNVTTLRLENLGDLIDTEDIIKKIKAGSRIRLIGFDWSFDTIDAANTFIETYLDVQRGIDENGNNTDKAQLSGIVRIPSLTGAQLAVIKEKYPGINVVYQHITSNLYFYNYDGSTLLQTVAVADGGDGTYTGSSTTRPSTAQYIYSFAGWSLNPKDTTANPNALKKITADRKVYAAFTATIRKYTVYFYNGTTLLQTVSNVAYGSSATYTGDTPVSSEDSSLKFLGWNPSPTNITGNTSCYAQFEALFRFNEITDTWQNIVSNFKNNTASYTPGDYKDLSEDYENIDFTAVYIGDKCKRTYKESWLMIPNNTNTDLVKCQYNNKVLSPDTSTLKDPYEIQFFKDMGDNCFAINNDTAAEELARQSDVGNGIEFDVVEVPKMNDEIKVYIQFYTNIDLSTIFKSINYTIKAKNSNGEYEKIYTSDVNLWSYRIKDEDKYDDYDYPNGYASTNIDICTCYNSGGQYPTDDKIYNKDVRLSIDFNRSDDKMCISKHVFNDIVRIKIKIVRASADYNVGTDNSSILMDEITKKYTIDNYYTKYIDGTGRMGQEAELYAYNTLNKAIKSNNDFLNTLKYKTSVVSYYDYVRVYNNENGLFCENKVLGTTFPTHLIDYEIIKNFIYRIMRDSNIPLKIQYMSTSSYPNIMLSALYFDQTPLSKKDNDELYTMPNFNQGFVYATNDANKVLNWKHSTSRLKKATVICFVNIKK